MAGAFIGMDCVINSIIEHVACRIENDAEKIAKDFGNEALIKRKLEIDPTNIIKIQISCPFHWQDQLK